MKKNTNHKPKESEKQLNKQVYKSEKHNDFVVKGYELSSKPLCLWLLLKMYPVFAGAEDCNPTTYNTSM
ncbi:hypothetical protein V2J09_000248 [Rumex salicifolius]